MHYEKLELQDQLTVRKLISFFYLEMSAHFRSNGEKHHFWELVFVDKGKLEVAIDGEVFLLEQGELVFYRPDEYHVGGAARRTAPNIMILSFECDSPAMETFMEQRIFWPDEKERELLSLLVKECQEAFEPVGRTRQGSLLQRRANAEFGCEQLIRLYLESFLIHLIRRHNKLSRLQQAKPITMVKENRDRAIVNAIIAYLGRHVSDNPSIDQLCHRFTISKTYLNTAFRRMTGASVQAYSRNLKIELAKTMIREESYTYTEISERLGYTSIHYFSRRFKRETNMTPTEYARTIQSKVRRIE
ncbi:AraC family transcriptional regulator [Paenibacillus sp. PAMC21692]|uniref:AraC family transcriptional regulator n=1 Tax=Paenibacillus sp. PAMC21692 TaxID=2762320 RepID=UPI00164E0290|nr:AraC family transcriptional regulator [Paenibacillus sp. PAMC21692]QNK57223.1 helix-turn-helix transcriptional regulator [Paenibacillus sp. PAMC21692]